jgi:hypothetical protein
MIAQWCRVATEVPVFLYGALTTMPKLSLILVFTLASGVGIVRMNTTPAEAADSAGPHLQHVVLFKFKDGTSPESIQKVVDAFAALPGKIDTIQAFEWGTDVSPEHKSEGFTHCFLVTFKDPAGRDVYLPHPAHKEFGTIVRPHLDKVLVVDFVSGK